MSNVCNLWAPIYSLPDIISIILSSFNFYYQAKAIRWSLSIEDRPWDNFIFKMSSARRQWHVTCEWWTPNWTQSCLCGHFNSSNLVICWLLTFCPVSVGWVMEEKQVSQSYQTFSAKLCQHQDHCDTVKSGRGKYTDSKTVRQFFYFLLSTVRQYIDIAAL